MVIEHLECFLTVARYMNFTKAAKSMFLSQSTLSRNISELENDLGVKLFERNNRFVRLTSSGETLLRAAPSLIQEIKKVERRVYSAAKDRVGVLSIAMPRFFERDVYKIINDFVRKYSPANIRLMPYIRGDLLEVFNNPHTEMVVAYSFELPESLEGFDSMKLFTDNLVLLVSEHHHLAKRGKLEFSDLANEHVILINRHADSMHKRFIARLFDLDVTTSFLTDGSSMELPDIENLLLQVRAGAGIAFLPRTVALANSMGCELVELVDMDSSYDALLLWRNDVENELIDYMLDGFRRVFPK